MISLGAFVFAWDHEMAYYFPPPIPNPLLWPPFSTYIPCIRSLSRLRPPNSLSLKQTRKGKKESKLFWAKMIPWDLICAWLHIQHMTRYGHYLIFNIWLDMGSSLTWYGGLTFYQPVFRSRVSLYCTHPWGLIRSLQLPYSFFCCTLALKTVH